MQSKAGEQAPWQGMGCCGVFLHGITRHGNVMNGSAQHGTAWQCKAHHFETSTNLATLGFGKAPLGFWSFCWLLSEISNKKAELFRLCLEVMRVLFKVIRA